MICIKPYFSGGAAFGCGQCMPCRFNKRRLWAHRISLEALCHGDNSFVTLTYADDAVRSVVPRDLSLWLKRMRRNPLCPPLRFFAVGEYGDRSGRPHYHAALFGFPSCQLQNSRVIGECSCQACSVVRKTWGYGHVMVGTLTHQSASYLAGYVTKKMTSTSDVRLAGRHPEFARMSFRPGIGAAAMWDVASVIMQYKLATIPTALRQGSRILPLGRYLRAKLSEYADKQIEKSFTDQRLQLVRKYAFDNSLSLRECWGEFAAPAAVQLEKQLKAKQRTL